MHLRAWSVLLVCAAMVCVYQVAPALAHWDVGDPYKAEDVYLPDVSTNGMDVNASFAAAGGRYILFDDFLCAETGPITAVHLWGSWLNDVLPANGAGGVTFVLSFHESDNGAPDLANAWSKTFTPGQFTVRTWSNNLEEGWMEPGGDYSFPGDTVCWQYNFHIDPSEAFQQQWDERYWLNVAAIPSDPNTSWGWKTTPIDSEGTSNWARWTYEASPDDGAHNTMSNGTLLIYPPGHPYEADPNDIPGTAVGVNFAFVVAPEPATVSLLVLGGLALAARRRRS